MMGSWLCLTLLKYIFEFMINFWVPSRVCDAEGGAVCSKNAAFGYFDGTACTPRLLSPTALMAPVILILKLDLLTSRAFERVARLWARSASERKFVPGPTTPDQKTKRTTLRKSILKWAGCRNKAKLGYWELTTQLGKINTKMQNKHMECIEYQ